MHLRAIRKFLRRRLPVLGAILQAGLTAAVPAAQAAAPTAALAKTNLPARGRQETILTVARFGRYALTVKSDQGVALQIVDRMAGPGASAGRAGAEDGRLDLFLDRGEYKVVAHADPKGSGTMALAVREFAEANAPRAPRLTELKLVETSLDDFSQASWWIELAERRPVAIEAAGRNLADLRLWKDGGWLVDAAPETETVQPAVGQPLAARRLATTLEPGLYLLTAYGGPAVPWSEDSPKHPLCLRWGIPSLPEAGRRGFAVGPFGTDRYLVPGSANYFRLELPEARAAELTVGEYVADHPFAAQIGRAAITKKSLPPAVELDAGRDPKKLHVVTVTAPAGQPYALQHFEAIEQTVLSTSGRYWLSTIHSGDPADSVDATAIVIRQIPALELHSEPYLEQVVELDSKTGWARRCNLLEPLTVFVRVRTAGTYEILSRGTDALFRFEPFFTYRPARYRPPDFQRSGSKWDLDAGYYVLTVQPEKKGVLDALVRPVGLFDFALDALFGKPASVPKPVSGAAQFPSVSLDSQYAYHVYLNRQPQVRSGLVLRALPLDLANALPLALRPGETISAPFQETEPGVLRCESEDGAALDLSVDGRSPEKTARVAPGSHTVAVRSGLAKSAVASLVFLPERLSPTAPLPALEDAALAALPALPVLGEKAPAAFDLAAAQVRSFLVRAAEPALYRLETTGLLATSGNLRSRTEISLLKNVANGVGRNFLIQSYLRPGDYQLSVSPLAPSAGHAGLKLSRAPLIEGGALADGIPARADLPAGQGIVYTFEIPRAATYAVRAIGLGHQFRGRLEDAAGWPLVAPNGPADYTRRFEAGSYRLVVLPEAVASRAVTLLERGPLDLKFEGHGPHALPLARRVAHLWMEPANGASRAPDVWTFALPAAAETSLELTDEMTGELLRLDGGGKAEKVATLPPSRGWKGRLEAGRYRLETACVRSNSSLRYHVAVWPEPLLAGLTRQVTAPVSLPVSVGADGLVELSSFGRTDVRGRLYDSDGRLVAANDDRPGDWNFSIARRLARGAYRLQVDPVGAKKAATAISMAAPREIAEKALAVPASQAVSPGSTVHVFPLEIPRGAGLLAVSASSVENVGLALEIEEAGAWRSIGSRVGRSVRLETALSPGAAHRLRLWSADRRGAAVDLSAFAPSPAPASESALARGLALVSGPSGAAYGAVALERAGLFEVKDGAASLRACPAAETLCEDAGGGPIGSAGGTLWLVKDGAAVGSTVRAERVALSAGAPRGVLVGVAAGRTILCDVARASGGPLLVTARSASGQPGVSLVPMTASGSAAGVLRSTAVGLRSSVAASLSGARPAARVWAAEPEAEPFDATLSATEYAAPVPEKTGWGAISGTVSGVSARAFDLSAGGKRVRLAVGGGTVAVLSRSDEVLSVHWAGDERFDETVETSADRLTLLHTRAPEDRFTVETLPLAAAESQAAIAPGAPFERAMDRAGWTRLAVAPAAAGPLTAHVRGAEGEALWLSAEGEVRRGRDLPVTAGGGTLLVAHGTGPLLCWVDREDAPGEGLWAAPKAAAPARDVGLPSVLALEGPAQTFRVAASGPVLVHVRSATPLVTRWKRGDAPARVEAHLSGCDLDVFLPGGPAEIGLRALTGRTLWGTAEITSTPLAATGEGLGPEVLVPSGGTRGFTFEVKRNGPVGVGARADSDVVTTTVWSADGRALGSGVVQMPQLSPGRYVLAIHVPPASPPVSVRPALSGIEPPSLDPPDAVIQAYLAREAEGASFSATRGAQPRVAAPQDEAPADEEENDDEDPPERTPYR